MIATLRPKGVVYIRYIGAMDKKSPFRRHREDLLMRSLGVLAPFVSSVGRLFPVIIDCCAVYEFREAQQVDCTRWRKGGSLQSLPEQALTALFGLPFLLNQTIGGFGHTFLEDDSQSLLFQSLQTNISVTMAELHPASSELKTELDDWVHHIYNYAFKHRLSVIVSGKKDYNFSEALRSIILKQVIPALYRREIYLFVTVGSGISKAGFLNAEPFYAGPAPQQT
jgi:hypothetical protein